jgi:hypothetical protein
MKQNYTHTQMACPGAHQKHVMGLRIKPHGLGTREKVSSRRINLEGNTHAQESNASQLPV